MSPLEKIHEILKDPACARNIKVLTFSICLVSFFLCMLVYGFALFGERMNERDIHFENVRMMKENVTQINRLKDSIMPACFKGRK